MRYTVDIERMAYSADAVGHLPDGKTVFVAGAAPGDTVEIEIVDDRKTFARGKVVEIVEASPSRVEPASPIDQLCGTAPWQHLSYEAQLAAKRANVVGALEHTAHFDTERASKLVGACVASKRTWGYRNKLELGCGRNEAGAFVVGFHREGSAELVEAESSKLAHRQIEKAPKALRGAIRYAQGDQDLGIFRIGVRHSLATGDLEVALWTRPGAFPRALFAKALTSACKATGVIRVLADPGKARKIKGVEVLGGRGKWRDRIGEVEKAAEGLPVPRDLFVPHGRRAHPDPALAVERTVNHHQLLRLGVAGGADQFVFIALEMAIAPGPEVIHAQHFLSGKAYHLRPFFSRAAPA